MTNEGKKLEPPLKLDMSFGEALARAIQTKPSEVEESIERSKQKKPPGANAPGGSNRNPSKSRNRKPVDGG
jgi:hypothetical protein